MRNIGYLIILLLGFLVFSCFGPDNTTPDSYDILYHSERWGTWIIVSDIYGNSSEICPDSSMVDQVDGVYCSKEGSLIFSVASSYTHSRDIYLYEPSIDDLTRLTDTLNNDCYPSLSQNNKFLAYTSRNYQTNGSNIYIMNMETKTHKQLTYENHNHYYPVFSPDGSKILFSEYFNNQNHLSIIDTNLNNYYVLESQSIFYSGFQFSSTGNKIFYKNIFGIVSCDLDGSNMELVADKEPGYIHGCFTAPIDSLLYYSRIDLENDVYTINKVNVELNKTNIVKHFTSQVVIGDISSDGLLILYTKSMGRGESRICLYDIENDAETYISDVENWDHTPRFNRYLY